MGGSDLEFHSLPAATTRKRKLKDTVTERGRTEVKNSTKARTEAYLNLNASAFTQNTIEVNQGAIPGTSRTIEQQEVNAPSSQTIPTASPASSQTQTTSQNQTQAQTIMSATNPKVVSFKVPRSWEANGPKFTTEDPDDLLDFIDQVGEIIELADIKDDGEKKKLLTSYLPVKKRTLWRNMENYATLSYDEFLKQVYKSYPELKEETVGTIEDLDKLC